MEDKYKSINGYYKHYNKEGRSCRIKVSRKALSRTDDEFILKYRSKSMEHWLYHSPRGKFRCANAVIVHILKNLENDNMIFKII